MRVILLIALKDLRQRVRDRSAVVLGFLAPLAIATLMSFAFSGTSDLHVDVAVADADRGPLSTAYLDLVRSDDLSDLMTVTVLDSEAEVRQAVDDGDVDAGVSIPPGFSDIAQGATPAELVILTSVDATFSGQVVQAVTESFTAQIDANVLSVRAALAAGAPVADLPALSVAVARESIPVQVEPRPAGTQELTAISYYAPAMGIFFVFFAITFGAKSFFEERSNGTLDRVTAAPVRPSSVLLGKSLSTFVYAIASLTTMAVVTSVAFDADWGPVWATASLVVAIALVVVGLTALVTAVAKTDRQADGIGSIVVFALVLLGGNFIYVWASTPALQAIALFTPNGWVLRAFTDMATGGEAVAAVVPAVLVCLAFAAVSAAIAALLSRRVLSP